MLCCELLRGEVAGAVNVDDDAGRRRLAVLDGAEKRTSQVATAAASSARLAETGDEQPMIPSFAGARISIVDLYLPL